MMRNTGAGMPEGTGQVEVIERFYRALVAGDLAGMRACCTADAVFWHSFDGTVQTLDEACQGWEALFEGFAERRVSDATRLPIPGGVLERHLFKASTRAGEWKAWAVCNIIILQEGLIARLDEYIDRAGLGSPPVDDRTPGLPAP